MRRKVLGDYIRSNAVTRGSATALVFGGRQTSFAALDRGSNRVANALIAEGVAPGDRVAYLGRNSDLYFEYWIGAAKAGAVLVSVNWRLAAPEIAYILDDCAPRAVLAEPDFLACVNDREGRVILATETIEGRNCYARWRDDQPDTDPHRDAGYDEAVLQLYTSGTTGHPKGAMLTNRSLFSLRDGAHAAELPAWYRWSDSDVALIAMPVFHISGSGWGLWSLQHGATGIIVREFDPGEVLDLIARYRITKVMMVPTALRIVCQQADPPGADYSCLETICYGGAPMPADLLGEAIARFGCGFAQMYGMTETAGTITGLPPEDHDVAGNARMRSVGRPLPGVELRIVDPDGCLLPGGKVGEILIRSGANMAGYHNLPDATAEALDAEGWLHTGDAGQCDEDGYLYLADRIKDMIITGGENVYPTEVERALSGHPQVQEVAVIGVPDAKWGEAVKAIVVPVPGAQPDPAELIGWARQHIAAYKAPKSIAFRSELPRNASGKVLRRQLRQEYG